MESAETPSRQQVPVWVAIALAVFVAASGPAFFHEGPFIGLASCLLVAYVHFYWRELSFGSRLLRALGLGAIIGVLSYPVSLALSIVAGFASGFATGFMSGYGG